MGLPRSRGQAGALCVPLLVLLLPFGIPLVRLVGLESWLRPAVAAPPGLEEAMRREPGRRLTAGEAETLKRDGVVLLRGVLTPEVTRELGQLAWKHTMMPFIESRYNQKAWFWNGAIRSLVKDSPFGELLASSLNFEENWSHTLRLHEAPIWSWPPQERPIRNAWHVDSRQAEAAYMTIWVVLTNGSKPFEFVRGSHLRREQIEEECGRVVPGGKQGFKELDDACVNRYIVNLDKEREDGPAMWGEDLVAGDSYLFGGSMLHAGIRQNYDRLAISLRAAVMQKFPFCLSDIPRLIPRGNDHDLHCAPWVLFPGLVNSPLLPVSLGWMLR